MSDSFAHSQIAKLLNEAGSLKPTFSNKRAQISSDRVVGEAPAYVGKLCALRIRYEERRRNAIGPEQKELAALLSMIDSITSLELRHVYSSHPHPHQLILRDNGRIVRIPQPRAARAVEESFCETG